MRMFKFTPTVNDAIIHGYLYWCEDIEDRSQDMLEASFPNGALLCAGWEPEDDPEGKISNYYFSWIRDVVYDRGINF